MSKPFLLIQIRPEDKASDDEYASLLKFGELSEDEVVRVRLDQTSLPKINLDAYSGIILGGGPWNPSDPKEKQSEIQLRGEAELFPFVKTIIERDKPCLAICYGLEAVACATNTPLTYEFGESAGAVDLILTEDGTNDPLLTNLPNPFRGFVGHKESLGAVPQGAVLLIRSNTCPVEMFRLGQNIYATQYHPELDAEAFCDRTDIYKHAGYFSPEKAESLKETARIETITVPMEIMKRFFERYRS
jgi:GMP synthase (glutamine-hydrolysing)